MNIESENPFYVNGSFSWFEDDKNQRFLEEKNDFNLPGLKNLKCFIVKNEDEDIHDFVLIDNKQNVIGAYKYPLQQHEYETFIKMLKIQKHYDESEGVKSRF